MNRNRYYDVLRVLAMMLVIGVHAVGSIEQYAVSSFGKTEVLILDRLNSFGVPMFFALSGVFLLGKTYDDLSGFYKKRFIRIGIPYLVYAVIYVVYFTGFEQHNIMGIPLAYIVDILTANVHPTHWFVYSIAALYLITPFLSKMMNSLSDKEVFVLISGCFSLMSLKLIFSCLGMDFGISSLYFDTYPLIIFIGGYSARRLSMGFKPFNLITKFRLPLLAFFIVAFVLWQVSVFQWAAVLLMMMENKTIFKQGKHGFLETLSNYSYSVYLIHAAVISFVLRIYKDWTALFEVKVLVIYFVILLLSYLIARCVDFFITNRLIAIFNHT